MLILYFMIYAVGVLVIGGLSVALSWSSELRYNVRLGWLGIAGLVFLVSLARYAKVEKKI